jgi:hypothetical protein
LRESLTSKNNEITNNFFPSTDLASKQAFFSRVVVALVTIVTPHAGILMIPRRLTYNTGNINSFLIIYWKYSRNWTVGTPDLLQILQMLDVKSRFFIRNFKMSMLVIKIASCLSFTQPWLDLKSQ